MSDSIQNRGAPDGEKRYIGDGVYASHDGYMMRIETKRDNSVHYIYFEPKVYRALVEFARTIGWQE